MAYESKVYSANSYCFEAFTSYNENHILPHLQELNDGHSAEHSSFPCRNPSQDKTVNEHFDKLDLSSQRQNNAAEEYLAARSSGYCWVMPTNPDSIYSASGASAQEQVKYLKEEAETGQYSYRFNSKEITHATSSSAYQATGMDGANIFPEHVVQNNHVVHSDHMVHNDYVTEVASNTSQHTGCAVTCTRHVVNREGATQRERNRMQALNQGFEALRKVVPRSVNMSEHQRLSKIATLRQAIQYLGALGAVLSDAGVVAKVTLPQQQGTRTRLRRNCGIYKASHYQSKTRNVRPEIQPDALSVLEKRP